MKVRRRHLRAGPEVAGVAAQAYLAVACLITRPRKSDADSGSIPLSFHPDAPRIAPLPFTSTALAGARPPFTVGLVARAWHLTNAVSEDHS